MKKIGNYLMGVLYVFAGINHFLHSDFYIKMIEGFLPKAALLVQLSGVAEIVLGIGVLIPSSRRISAWGIILLLIAVFPANINMAMHPADWNMNPLMLYIRLPIQFLLILWAYYYTKRGN